MPKPNYGPAGIFSTDNPVSDAMQIAAEEGPWEEWEDEEGLLEEQPLAQVELYGCCPECIWWDSTFYWTDDPVGLEGATQRLRERHEAECPHCFGALEFAWEEG